MQAITRMPLFLLMLAIASASCVLPAIFALAQEGFHDARAFFYSGLVGMILTAFAGLAMANRDHNRNAFRQLVALLAGFTLLPVFLAVPFYEAVRNTTFLSAYFEMVSSLTTTGATLFEPERLSGPEHLWRAQVGWMGGLLIWVSAAAIMAPLTLGGFEVTASGEPGQSLSGSAMNEQSDPGVRLLRSFQALFPVYFGLTVSLCVMLLVAGDPPLVALSHAMAVMSTSGISPTGSVLENGSGLAGEMILMCFMVFALSRLTFAADTGSRKLGDSLWHDPEFRLGLIIVVIVPCALFLRHWWGALDVGGEENIAMGLTAFWGALFTAASYLSTTGFVSANWEAAQSWSGLSTPGIILMGLALVGGGVATTAGGVKLLRVFALYMNGAREIEKLVHPSSVGRSGFVSRRTRREAGFISWVFFMLFALTLAAITVTLGLVGVGFEQSLVLSVSVLSNTGPLISFAPSTSFDLIALAPAGKLILCVGMVLGRLELLAIIVMLSPDLWRD